MHIVQNKKTKKQIPVEGGISNEEKHGNINDRTYPGFSARDGSKRDSI